LKGPRPGINLKFQISDLKYNKTEIFGISEEQMARQKLKNHSGASKRFKRTGSGKWMRRRAGKRHILTSKHPEKKRRLSGSMVVRPEDRYALDRLMPYK